MSWFRTAALSLAVSGLLALVGGVMPVTAQNWGGMAMISETMGVSDSRICIGESSRGDIGCPGYAPTISATGRVNMTAGLTVDAVSLTTAGVTWGYLGSAASYVPNLSSNGVSVTTISTTAVQIISTTIALECNGTNAGTLRYNSPTTALELCTGSGWQVMGVGIPAGTISAFASTTCPTGWSEYTPARGRFLRGIDNGAGNDPAGTRAPGAIQTDAFQGHFHSANAILSGGSIASGGAYTGGGPTGAPITDGSNGTPRTANETRPKNVAITYCQFNGTSNGWNNPLSGGSTVPGGSTSQIQYNTSGSFDGNAGLTWTNANQLLTATNISATALTVNGVAITGGASGDRVTSGTTSVLVNSATNVISLTTAGTTWGYLGSVASYVPNLSSNGVSATNISVSTINGISVSALGTMSPTNVPAFRATKGNTNQTLTTSTVTKLTWSTESYDTYNNFASSRFTPTIAGYYYVTLSIYCSNLTSGQACSPLIYKNGANVAQGIIRSPSGAVISNINDIVYMNGSTDYLEAWGYSEASTAVIVGDNNATWFTGTLVASGNGLVSGTGGATALSGLTDVAVSSPTSGTVLTYNGGTSKWEAMAASGGLGYAITSGTTSVTVNSATSVISLTTAGTTWGYLGSAASYVPNLSSNNISLTTINGVSASNYLFASSTLPVFKVHKNGTGQTLPATTWTKLTFSTKELDTNNNFSTATSRYTPTVAGNYLFSGSAYCTGAVCWTSVYKNGVQVSQNGSNNWTEGMPSTNVILSMNGSTDYVEFYSYNNGTTVSGVSNQTYFQGFLLGGGGSGGVSGTGVSELSALTDVTLSSPVSGSVLTYNAGTSKWVNAPLANVMSTTTMVSGWPDAIVCNVTSPVWGPVVFYPSLMPYADGKYHYRANTESGTSYGVIFTAAKAFDSYTNLTTTSCNKSISTLYTDGQAFNFIGNSGSGGSAMGDRLTSGTLAVTANSTTSVISLTTAGTTWGYLGSAASYLPNLNSLVVSSTNISVTNINGRPASSFLFTSSSVPSFAVHKNGTNQTVTANTWTKLTFSTKSLDTMNAFSTGTSRFQPTVGGTYLITGGARCGTGATVSCWLSVYKNGSPVTQNGNSNNAASNDVINQTTAIVSLNGSTDYVEIYVYTTATTIDGLATYTRFEGSLLGGASSGSGGGGGATALSGLTDVALASPASGQVLSYNGTSWVNITPSASSVISGTTTMLADWPDAIMCMNGSIKQYFYLLGDYDSSNKFYGTTRQSEGSQSWIWFNNTTKAYAGNLSSGSYDCATSAKTISTLYTEGRAFNFIGNSGSGGGSTDAAKLISGTLEVIANGSTGYVSLSTASSTWGYLGSAVSYLPVVSSGRVSATAISATAVQITSATTALACSGTNAGTLRYNSTNTALELCTGSGWQAMGVGIPAGTISAFASTTCPTGWSEYTPARGRFLRGIDNGAGNDPSGTRTPGDVQGDLLKSHSHTAPAGSEVVYMRSSGNYTVIGSGGFGIDRSISPLGSTGGSETRPVNVAITYCQFNGTSNGWNNPLSGGSTVPGGNTGQIQYNSAGAFAASAGLVWDNANSRLTVTNISATALTVNGVAITGSGSSDQITSGTTSVVANSAGTVTVSGSVQVTGSIQPMNNTGGACTGQKLGAIAVINGRAHMCRAN